MRFTKGLKNVRNAAELRENATTGIIYDFYALKYYISLKLEEILLVELFPRCGSSLMVHLSFSIFTSA